MAREPGAVELSDCAPFASRGALAEWLRRALAAIGDNSELGKGLAAGMGEP